EILKIDKKEMTRALHEQHELSDIFVAYLLSRNRRVQEDLVDQLFNSSEKRLARADRKSTRLNSSHLVISYAVFCLKKKKAEGLVSEPYTEVERRVYILAYLMHDVDKIVHSHVVETVDRNAIEIVINVIEEQMRLCN